MGLFTRFARQAQERFSGCTATSSERGAWGDETVEYDYPYLSARVARGKCLAVCPHAQHRVALTRVELGYDDDLQASSHPAFGGAVG
jgi:hypothetical protein